MNTELVTVWHGARWREFPQPVVETKPPAPLELPGDGRITPRMAVARVQRALARRSMKRVELEAACRLTRTQAAYALYLAGKWGLVTTDPGSTKRTAVYRLVNALDAAVRGKARPAA